MTRRAFGFAGDGSRLPFVLLYELRSLAGEQRAHAIVSTLGIALAVALATGLEIASRSVGHALEPPESLVALEVSTAGVGVAEALLPVVAATPGVVTAAPVIEATFWLVGDGLAGEALHVLGLDFAADRGLRDAEVRDGVRVVDPLRLLARPDSIVVAESLLVRAGVEIGGELQVRSANGPQTFTVRGALAPGGLSDAWSGQLALMDVYALQHAAGIPGTVDRIELALAPGADVARVEADLRARLAGRASVRRPRNGNEMLAATLATLRIAAWTFASIATVVAGLLSYGTAANATQRRLPELAFLRAAGLEARRVRRLVWVDALVVASVGTLVGLAAGAVLSRGFVGLYARVLRFHESRPLEALGPSVATVGIALAVGVLVSLAGALGPALRAGRVAPLELLDARAAARPGSGARALVVAALAALAVTGFLVAPPGIPVSLRVAGLIAASLAAFGALAAPALDLVLRRAAPALERALPSIGPLVGTSLRARPGPVRLTAVALAGIVTGVACVFSVVESFASAVDGFGQRWRAGAIYVYAGDTTPGMLREPLLPETFALLRGTPGVETLHALAFRTVEFRSEEIGVQIISAAVYPGDLREDWIGADPARVPRALAAGGVAASESFARHFGVSVGDRVELPGPGGASSFEIAATFADIGGPPGTLEIDAAVAARHFRREVADRAVVFASIPAEELIARIRARIGERQPLVFVHGDRLRRRGAELVAPYLGLLRLTAALLCVLAGACVVNAQLGAVLERRRELALLRVAGATPRQVLAVVVLDATLVAGFAAAAGVGLGLACGWPSVGVFGDTFGWKLSYVPDVRSIAGLAIGTLAASALGALYPALRAARIQGTDALSGE